MLTELFKRHRLSAEVWDFQTAACDAECAVTLEICAYRTAEMEKTARCLLGATRATGMGPAEVNALLTPVLLPVEKSNNGDKST